MRTLVAVWALPILLLSGCLGGSSDPAQVSDPITVVEPTLSTTPIPIDPDDRPKYHPHDLWGGRTSVLIFESEIGLGEDAVEESYYREGALVSGRAEFNLRTDGDDSESSDKADVVYQGTKGLVVKFSWTNDPGESVPGITFLYKPANAARFSAVENVPKDQELYLPLGKGMADMPHQQKLSRWRFAVEAFDPQMATAPTKVHVARGDVQVSITAINGGQRSIDPPHPYNFLESGVRPAGEINKVIESQVVRDPQTGLQHQLGTALAGWQVDAPHIIYWDTTVVKVKLHYNYTGPAGAVPHELGLVYTDASGPEAKAPVAKESRAGFAYYEIPLTGIEGDDPYASKSDWTWGVRPVLNGQDQVSEFKGDVHLAFVVEGSDEVME